MTGQTSRLRRCNVRTEIPDDLPNADGDEHTVRPVSGYLLQILFASMKRRNLVFADGEDLEELAVGRSSLDVDGCSDAAGVKKGLLRV